MSSAIRRHSPLWARITLDYALKYPARGGDYELNEDTAEKLIQVALQHAPLSFTEGEKFRWLLNELYNAPSMHAPLTQTFALTPVLSENNIIIRRLHKGGLKD